MSGPNAGAYWPQPWTCEDGGPRRWGVAAGQPGLGIAAGRDAARRRRPRRLRHRRAPPPRARRALRAAPRHPARRRRSRRRSRAGSSGSTRDRSQTVASSPRLPAGSGGRAASPPTPTATCTWCSGRWAHRLDPGLEVLASHRLPVPRPHNSFVVLDGGELVTKDCDAPAGLEPSTVSVLDPISLLPVAAAAAAAGAVDRAALLRRRERDRRRHHDRLPASPRPRRRSGS